MLKKYELDIQVWPNSFSWYSGDLFELNHVVPWDSLPGVYSLTAYFKGF